MLLTPPADIRIFFCWKHYFFSFLGWLLKVLLPFAPILAVGKLGLFFLLYFDLFHFIATLFLSSNFNLYFYRFLFSICFLLFLSKPMFFLFIFLFQYFFQILLMEFPVIQFKKMIKPTLALLFCPWKGFNSIIYIITGVDQVECVLVDFICLLV